MKLLINKETRNSLGGKKKDDPYWCYHILLRSVLNVNVRIQQVYIGNTNIGLVRFLKNKVVLP